MGGGAGEGYGRGVFGNNQVTGLHLIGILLEIVPEHTPLHFTVFQMAHNC